MYSPNLCAQYKNVPYIYYSPYFISQNNQIINSQPYFYMSQQNSQNSVQNSCSQSVNNKQQHFRKNSLSEEHNFYHQSKQLKTNEEYYLNSQQNNNTEKQMANSAHIESSQNLNFQCPENIQIQEFQDKIDKDQNKNLIIIKKNKRAKFKSIQNFSSYSIELIQTIGQKQTKNFNEDEQQCNNISCKQIKSLSPLYIKSIEDLDYLNNNFPHFNQLKKRPLETYKKIGKQKKLRRAQIPKHPSNLYIDEQKEIICAKQNIKNFCEITKQSNSQVSYDTENEQIEQKISFSNICGQTLEQYIQKIYGQNFENKLKLTQQVVEDLSNIYQSQQKISQLNQGNSNLSISQQKIRKQDSMIELFNKCVYLITSSEIHKQFKLYCLDLNQNSSYSLPQNNQQLHHFENKNAQSIDLQSTINQYKINQSISNHSTNNLQGFIEEISQKNQQNTNLSFKSQFFFKLFPISRSFLKNFDFSNIRQILSKNTKKIEKKPNTSYVKNSQYHNLNKLFMYNILSMFRSDSLKNLNIHKSLTKELTKFILKFKISSRKDYKNPQRGFFDYFSHGHYKVLFLKINNVNIEQIRENERDIELHEKCFNIDLKKNLTEMELSYINIIKEINFNIFIVNIQHETLYDDGSKSKQNIRRKYTLRVIEGIQKLERGILIKRF